MPRYLVTTRRALRGRVPSAEAALRGAEGVTVIDARNPEMVTIEASPETATELGRRLASTHFVDPEIRHRLH